MGMRTFQCRSHPGGIFRMPARRGRPPVRCTDQHPCTLASEPQEAPVKAPERHAAAPTGANPSLPLAMTAKERLTAVGWECAGKASEDFAELVCSRGEESLVMRWDAGTLTSQQYDMNSPNPNRNGIPPHRLNFDPTEVTDGELANLIRGMPIKWWNTLGSSEESAIVGNKVTVTHTFVGSGDTDNSKRVITFIDHGGGGFRSFHAEALLKVG